MERGGRGLCAWGGGSLRTTVGRAWGGPGLEAGWEALEQFDGSAHDARAQTETEEYEIQTRRLSL